MYQQLTDAERAGIRASRLNILEQNLYRIELEIAEAEALNALWPGNPDIAKELGDVYMQRDACQVRINAVVGLGGGETQPQASEDDYTSYPRIS